MKALRVIFFSCFAASGLLGQPAINERPFIPTAQTASIEGNWALWHNPAGLAFMGGTEAALLYLYEWGPSGGRHQGTANAAINLWQWLTVALSVGTKAALSDYAKSHLGTEIQGAIGAAFTASRYASFGFSIFGNHNFLTHSSKPWLMSFGTQIRPFSFLSIGGYYEEVTRGFLKAPNLTAGISVRPYKDIFTLGIDSSWKPYGPLWSDGFRMDPKFSLKASFMGYAAAFSAEIPGIGDGWKRPIFGLSLDFNLAHFGLGLISHINSAGEHYGIGTMLRTSSEEWPSIAKPTGLLVELTIDSNGNLEQPRRSLTDKFFKKEPSALSVLALLKRIESDKSIGTIVLNLKGFSFGNAKTEEWRDAILSLRAKNKTVIVYLDSPDERDYFIATAAHKILMNKDATLSLQNFQTTLVYFADLLEKIGVKATAIAAGKYKTAPRQFTHARPEKEEIEVANNILNNFYGTLLITTSESRNLDKEVVQRLFDKGELTANLALSSGLVDELVEPDEGIDALNKDIKDLRKDENYQDRQRKQVLWHPSKKIAVIPIDDTIVSGRVPSGIFSGLSPSVGADDIIDEIEDAMLDAEVVGIIVRIDSPGGDAMAGHKIQAALKKAQKHKPVVTSMSDIAASAGYLVATGSDHILALPNTLTGSIGVFSLSFSFEKLANKFGVFSKELSPIKNPGPTTFRGFSKSEQREAQSIVDWYYQNFIDTVSKGINLDKAEVEKNANGRVWLGKEAYEKKLIDELGGFSKAIDKLRALAKISENEELSIDIKDPNAHKRFTFFKGLSTKALSDQDAQLIKRIGFPYLKAVDAYRLNQTPQARLPYDVSWAAHK